MDNKKKFNTNRLAAYALSGVMLASVVPYNVFANTEALNNNLEISDVIKSGQQKAGQEKDVPVTVKDSKLVKKTKTNTNQKLRRKK
ncbi:hypothetical protein [Peptoniphilus sp. Marseille-Q6390]